MSRPVKRQQTMIGLRKPAHAMSITTVNAICRPCSMMCVNEERLLVCIFLTNDGRGHGSSVPPLIRH